MNGRIVASNFAWKLAERGGAQLVNFVVNIVLARLLLPSDYGVIAIINSIILILNVLVSNGFASALIQKKNADQKDFSSVFYFSLIIALFMYLFLYIVAPYIEIFYGMPNLKKPLRVTGLVLFVNAINSVQHSYVSRRMEFKRFFLSTLSGISVSAVVGIYLAYNGYGVWALIAQSLSSSVVNTIILWFTVKWRPSIYFSWGRIKSIYAFGMNCLGSALIGAIADNIRTFVIGKVYTENDLAYYTRGDQFPKLVLNNVNTTISAVLFSALSSIQEDKNHLILTSRKTLRITASITAPLLFGMAAVAELMISLLLTDKWLPCIPYLKIGCVYSLITILYTSSLQNFKAIGRSDLSFKLELLDNVLGIVFLIVSINKGVIMIALSVLISRGIAYAISFFVTKCYFQLTIICQLKDIIIPIFLSFFMYISLRIIQNQIVQKNIYSLIVEITVGILLYSLPTYFLNKDMVDLVKIVVKRRR